jgi:hypothetical protein
VRPARLPWLFPAVSFAFGVGAAVLLGSIPSERLPRQDRLDLIDVLFSLGFVAYAVVGAAIAVRQPKNPVGWLFCWFGVLYPAAGVLWSYAMYGFYATDDGLPAQEPAAWLFAWSGEVVLFLIVLVLLLFPDGRFLSPRWRLAGYAAAATSALFAVGIAFDPGPLYTFEAIQNPLGVEAAGDTLELLRELGSVLLTALIVLAGISMIVRFRRAEPAARRQIKWLAVGAGAAVLLLLTFSVLEAVTETDRGLGEVVTSVLALLAMVIIPIAVAIAMLRHRLYDVDLVIRRTVVYGALTATLVAAYLGIVLLLQLALSPITEQSDLAIAGSTLAVAALVGPLRSRIQAVVDRRFFRSRYDATRTVEAFGVRLRDQVELGAVERELRSVVAQTMQPAQLALWLRDREAAP